MRYDQELLRLGRKPQTRALNVRLVERFLRDADQALGQLTRRHVQAHLAALADLGLATSTRAGACSAVRLFCRMLVAEGRLQSDPTAGIVIKAERRAPGRALSVGEVERLLEAAGARGPGRPARVALRDRALVELLYGLGLRASEARLARPMDLDLAQGTLAVTRLKAGPGAVLPLPRRALPHLARYLQDVRPGLVDAAGRDSDALLLTGSGQPLQACDVYRIVRKAGRRAGLEHVHPHQLRRSLATHLIEDGVSVAHVQRWLGHAFLTSTERYLAVEQDGLRQAVELLEQRGS